MKHIASQSLTAFAALALLTACSDPSRDVYRSSASTNVEPTTAAPSNALAYTIAESSTLGFVGSKVTGSHTGGFKEFAGTIQVANGKVVGSSPIEIQMDSTWSDNERLTGHLKSADFFDVEQFPTASFTVTEVEPSGAQHQVTGNLQLHGVTKSISFPATIAVSEQEVTVQAEFAINRKDFNITYPGRPDDLIRDNVVINLQLTANPS